MPIISLLPTAATMALRAPLVVVIPVYNEAANITTVIDEWSKAFENLDITHQFLLINDGSRDDTFAVLQRIEADRPDTVIVIDKPNSGHGRSCRLGYDAACASATTEWILQIDSDGQCDPKYFSEFWQRRLTADCVFGIRTKRDDGYVRMLTSKMCRYSATVLAGQSMGDANVPYRLMRRDALSRALKYIPPSFDIHNVAVTFVLKKLPDLRWEYVPIHFRDRQGGSNSINVTNVAQLGLGMLFDLNKLRKSKIS